MTALLTGRLAEILEARRSRFNAQFAEAKHGRPALDPRQFATHLTQVVAPLVETVARHAPDRADEVAQALYDLSLDLVGRDLLGPAARHPAIVEGWAWLLPQLPDRLAEAPRVFVGAITNALFTLAVTPGARPKQWLREVAALSTLCGSATELLEAAKVLAWRAGMAHYRASALDLCRRLSPPLATAALGLPETALDREEIDTLIHQLLADPWLDPVQALAGKPEAQHLHLVGRVGAFRGFGGTFMRPPRVTSPGGQFVASDGEQHWLIHADRFGATLHRLPALPAEKPVLAAPLFKVGLRGKVSRGTHQAVFPDLAVTHSSAANASTLAVTTPLSHAVYLIALVA